MTAASDAARHGAAPSWADVCVIGAGPAGLTLALDLCRRGLRVVVLESGSTGGSRRAESLSRGESAGRLTAPLHEVRKRGVGGTSRVWTSNIARLEPEAFTARTWLPGSGWPIDADEISDYIDSALEVFGSDLRAHDLDELDASRSRHPLFDDDELAPRSFVASDVRDVSTRWRDELQGRDLTILTDTHALRFESNDSGDRIVGVECVRGRRERTTVAAEHYVVAGGAIETARLLLASKDTHHPTGIGDHSGHLGRWYQDHPFSWCGTLATDCDTDLTEFLVPPESGRSPNTTATFITLADRVLSDEQLLRPGALLLPGHAWMASPEFADPSIGALRRIRRAKQAGHVPLDLGRMTYDIVGGARSVARIARKRRASSERTHVVRLQVQQSPQYESSVTLSDRTDRFGVPMARVDWRLGDIERRSAARLLDELGERVESAGLGRFEPVPEGTDGWPFNLEQGYHPSGTTRMSADPSDGVVTPDCRVHNFDNLWIASSSIFPIAGMANPTLTVAALALRLAAHLDGDR